MTVTEPKTSESRPYRAEYARSGGSVCRRCGRQIGRDALRLAVMTESATVENALTPQFYHYSCFWKQNRVGKLDDIEGWRDLRPDDQQLLEERIHGVGVSEGLTSEEESTAGGPTPMAEERPAISEAAYAALERGAHAAGMRIFKVGYARSRGSYCRSCDTGIAQGSLRIGKRDTDTEHAMRYGPRVNWHHVKCFYENREALEFTGNKAVIEDVPGFNLLHEQDKRRLIEMFGGAGKKGGERPKSVTNVAEPPLRTFKPRMAAEEEAKEIEGGSELEEGEVSPVERAPRQKENVPTAMEQGEAPVKAGRAPSTVYQRPTMLPSGERPLANLRFFMAGRMSRPLHEVRDEMERLGAIIVPDIDQTVVAAILSDYKARIGTQSKHVRAAMEANVHVVGEDFVDAVVNAARLGRLVADPASYHEAKESANGQVWLADLVVRHSMVADCGSDVAARIRRSLAQGQEVGGRRLGKSTSEAVEPPSPQGPATEEKRTKMSLALTVDPESELEDEAHVLQEGNCVWNILLHSVPEVSVTNFYYRIQLLESNEGNAWWVYRSWGRVGTAIGSNKLDVFDTKEEAKRNFENIFEEKTGNSWNNGDYSKERFPGRYYPFDESELEAGEAQHISLREHEEQQQQQPQQMAVD